MSITKTNNTITYTPVNDADEALVTGVYRKDSFAVCDNVDKLKQIQFDPAALATNTQITLTAASANTGAFTLPPLTSATLGSYYLKTQTSAPAEAATVTLNAATQVYIGTPSGDLTTLTVVLPTTPPDGTRIAYVIDHAITNLVLTAGGSDTIVGAPTAASANVPKALTYLATATKWYLTS